jgi:hypothetical protein
LGRIIRDAVRWGRELDQEEADQLTVAEVSRGAAWRDGKDPDNLTIEGGVLEM